MSDSLLAKPARIIHTFHPCQLGAYLCLLHWEWVREKFSTQTQDNSLKACSVGIGSASTYLFAVRGLIFKTQMQRSYVWNTLILELG